MSRPFDKLRDLAFQKAKVVEPVEIEDSTELNADQKMNNQSTKSNQYGKLQRIRAREHP